MQGVLHGPNARGKRRRSTEGAQGTNKGHENAEGMALVGVRLTARLGWGAKADSVEWIRTSNTMQMLVGRIKRMALMAEVSEGVD